MPHVAHFDLVDEAAACRIIGGENTPIHRSTLWRGIRAGRFPPPLKVGAGTNRWRRCELVAVLERAAAERGDGWQRLGDVVAEIVDELDPGR